MDDMAGANARQTVSEPWRALWAKSYPRHALWRHLLDAAAVSLELPFRLEQDGWSPEQLAYVVALHDIGKVAPGFQHMGAGDAPELRRGRNSALAALRAAGGDEADHEWDARNWGDVRRNAFLAFTRARSVHELAVRSDEVLAAGYRVTGDAKCRHERMSAGFVALRCKELGAARRVADGLARAIVAHHGFWDEGDCPVRGEYVRGRDLLSRSVGNALQVDRLPGTVPADMSAFGMRVAGHVVLADWLASNEELFHRETLAAFDDLSDYLQAARSEARRVLRSIGLERRESRPAPMRIVDAPRGVQKAILTEHLPPGLVIVEAPMGEGKTEGAWMLAERWKEHGYHGIYMALPTQATSDSMYDRYRLDYLRKLGLEGDARLIHGMAWLRDDVEPDGHMEMPESPEDGALAAAWFRPTRRALLAPHGVGTVDQCLLAALKVKFGQLRLYGLDRRVLIVDEVHAYDAYMNAILQRLLAWCSAMRIPVVLLSATLSARQRAGLLRAYGVQGDDPGPEAPYPLITHGTPGGSVTSTETEAATSRHLRIVPRAGLLGDIAGTARLAEGAVAGGGCLCVVVNTVRNAQALYGEIRLPADQKGLFHARFTAEDREAIARRVTSMFGKDATGRPGRYVLVATQVVEQSLDVDFDQMISEIAPMDLLLQRSGRLHRHRQRDTDPELLVLLPALDEMRFGGTERVYDRYVLLRTLAMVAVSRTVLLPRDMRGLVESCYGDGPIPSGFVTEGQLATTKAAWDAEVADMAGAARPILLNEPSPRVFSPVGSVPVGDDSDDGNGWRAKTRLGANDRTCLLCPAEEAAGVAAGRIRMAAVRELYRRAVRVPHYVAIDAADVGYEPALRGEHALHGMAVVPMGADGTWRGAGYVVKYDQALGLVVERCK